MASARIPKFSWVDGEKMSFEVWYHNDTPQSVSGAVKAFVELGEKCFELLEWETGEIEANFNKIGPTVNFIIPPDESAKKIIVRLYTNDGIERNTGG